MRTLHALFDARIRGERTTFHIAEWWISRDISCAHITFRAARTRIRVARRHGTRARATARDTCLERRGCTRDEPGPYGPGSRCSPEQIRTAVTALRGRRPRPLDDGAVLCFSSSGGRTRTPNDRARTSCVADYTTPEGPEGRAHGSLTLPSLSQPKPSQSTRRSRRRGRAEPRKGALPAEQPDRSRTAADPCARALDRGVERGHHLPRLEAERLDQGAEIERVDGPFTRLDVRDDRVEHLARLVRSTRASPTTSGSIVNSASATNRKSICSTSCTERRRAFLARSRRVAERRRDRVGRRTAPARRVPRGSRVRRASAAGSIAVHPVELLVGRTPPRRA